MSKADRGKTPKAPAPWLPILWNEGLSDEELEARRRLDAAGLKPLYPIRAKLHRYVMPFIVKRGTIARVLPPILSAVDEAHAAFVGAAVEQLRREPAAALIEASAEDWIEEDANTAAQQLTMAGGDGLLAAELELPDPALGRRKWNLGGSELIAYACGLQPDVQNGAWAEEVRAKLEKQLHRLWPAEGEIRRLYQEGRGHGTRPKMTRAEVLVLLSSEPELAENDSELARRTGWDRNTFGRRGWPAILNRVRATRAIGSLEATRDKRGSRVLRVPPPEDTE